MKSLVLLCQIQLVSVVFFWSNERTFNKQTIYFYVILSLFFGSYKIEKDIDEYIYIYIILHTRAKRRFLGLWNCSQFLSLANSCIFFLRRSRVTLSSAGGPVIFLLLSNKDNVCAREGVTAKLETKTSLCKNFVGIIKRAKKGCFGRNRGFLGCTCSFWATDTTAMHCTFLL